MAEQRNILFRLLGDSRSLQRAAKSGESALSKMTSSARNVAGGIWLAFGASEIARFTQEAFRLGAAAEEVDSKFQAVFGSAEDLNRALADWGDLAGVTTTDAMNLAATFGNLAMAQGLSADATERLVVDVASLAGDMASFNDADPAQVFTDLNKALLTTEREGMKKYGIAISEAEVKQRALAIATADGRKEATKADRALASYEIAVEQAGQAVGDLERTQDSAANQTRQLQATLRELQIAFGRQLVPEVQRCIKFASDLIAITKSLSDTTGGLRETVDFFIGDLELLMDVMNPVGKLFEYVTDVVGEVKDIVDDTGPSFKEFADTADQYGRAVEQRYFDMAVAARKHSQVTDEELKAAADSVARHTDRMTWALNNVYEAYMANIRAAEMFGSLDYTTFGVGDDRAGYLDDADYRDRNADGRQPGSGGNEIFD